MVAKKLDYSGIPTSGELENNSNQRKYTINRSPKGDLLISKPICALMVIGAILLALLAALTVFLLLPRCTNATPQALVKLKEQADAIDERLPRSIEPTHYRIQLIPNIFGANLTTNGAETISLHVKESTDKIIFHSHEIFIDRESVKITSLSDDRNIKITDQFYDIEAQKYTIQLAENLVKDQQYSLAMNFVGKIYDNMQGFYSSKYTERLNEGWNSSKLMVSTQFSPTDARRAFPCFDEPSFKAKFTISLARPANLSTLSNMPLREKVVHNTQNNELVWDHYHESPNMSTYLVAFTASDLQPLRYNSSERFTVWSRRDAMEQARYAIDLGPRLLQHFEHYFGIPFPLPKIDMVAVPDFGFNAMENWGLITFREKALLFDESMSTINSKRGIAVTMSHEIAHQWFGNLVTPRWWNDLWLKEGFATYLSYFGVTYVEPFWNILEEFIVSVTHAAFKADYYESSRPVSFEVQNSNQIRQSFDDISYSKGAALIRMVNNFLGEEQFKLGLIRYLNKYRYSNADRNDLWECLSVPVNSGNLPASLNDIMDSWLLQPGFPVVTAIANYEENKLQVSQKQFLISGEIRNSSWWIPISLSTSYSPYFNDTKPTIWLKNSSEPLTTDLVIHDWYLLNLRQTGYYIVNYDEKNWKALIDNVMSLPVGVRSQLISDSMDLARANLLDYNIPLKLITIIATKDADITFVPYLTAFEKLTFLDNMLYSTSAYELFRSYLRSAFQYAFENVNFKELPPDDYIKQRIQQLVLEWSCKESDSRCVTDSRFMYRKWITDGKLVAPNLREVVYCTSIREGGDMEWRWAYQQYLTTDLPSEKEVLLEALGCTVKPWLLSRYLEFTLRNDSGIRKQDGPQVLKTALKNIAGHTQTFSFIRNNWIQLKERYGEAFKSISSVIDVLPTFMNTEFQLNELEDFRSKHLDTLGTSEQAFERSIENVRANVVWMKQSYGAVEKWLIDFNEHFRQR